MSVSRANATKTVLKREQKLRDFAMSLPDATEDFPWEHIAIKVRRRVFVFLSADERGLGVSLKIPALKDEALLLPFTEPTGYGLGKSGWVSARFGPKEEPPFGLLRAWIAESYRTIAPKKLVALLAAGGVNGGVNGGAARATTSARKPASHEAKRGSVAGRTRRKKA